MQTYVEGQLIVGYQSGVAVTSAAHSAMGVEQQGRVGSRGQTLVHIVDGTPAREKAAQLRGMKGERPERGSLLHAFQ